MKKTLIFGMLLFLGLCGCAETPEKEVVLSKTEGLPEGAAAEKSEEKKKISVPKKWEETISENNGAVTVGAKGVTISVPEVKNTPITEVKRTAFGEEQLKKLVDYFRGDNVIQAPLLWQKTRFRRMWKKSKTGKELMGTLLWKKV